MPPLINLIKQKFGRLKVLKRINNAKDGHACWLCQRDCGQKTVVIGNDLRMGKVRSCGCLHNEGNNTTHGYARKGKEHKL